MSRTSSYRQSLLDALSDPIESAAYLNAGLEDSLEAFLKALKNVAQAKQMKTVAKEAGIQRETLYRALSEQGNPTVTTLLGILSAVGLQIQIAPIEHDQIDSPVVVPVFSQGMHGQVISSTLPYTNIVWSDVKIGHIGHQPDCFGPLRVPIPMSFQTVQNDWSRGESNEHNR